MLTARIRIDLLAPVVATDWDDPYHAVKVAAIMRIPISRWEPLYMQREHGVNLITDGCHRLEAARRMGLTRVEVYYRRGQGFMVFETGNPKFHLFSALSRAGCQTGLQFPVRKADLRDDIRRALRYGWGNAGL